MMIDHFLIITFPRVTCRRRHKTRGKNKGTSAIVAVSSFVIEMWFSRVVPRFMVSSSELIMDTCCVSRTAGCAIGGSGFNIRHGHGNFFLSSRLSRSAVEPIQLPVHWIPALKSAGSKVDRWHSSGAEVKLYGAIPQIPGMSSRLAAQLSEGTALPLTFWIEWKLLFLLRGNFLVQLVFFREKLLVQLFLLRGNFLVQLVFLRENCWSNYFFWKEQLLVEFIFLEGNLSVQFFLGKTFAQLSVCDVTLSSCTISSLVRF